MILKSNSPRTLGKLFPSGYYSFSKFSQLLFLLRGWLNRIANQDKSQYIKRVVESENKNLPAEQFSQPKNASEEIANFQKKQLQISQSEKVRLYRLDEILQTKTYFHQTKLYEQRISHNSVMVISSLQQNHQESPRQIVDALNPQMITNFKMRNMRKNVRWVSKNLKKYPRGLQQMDPNDNIFNPSSEQMLKFLSEETLYTRISLNDLKFTEESIQKETVYQEKDGEIYNIEQQEATFIHRDQIYFRPSFAMSIYRMDIKQYKRKFRDSIENLTQALTNNTGHIQEVVTIEQIYDCLKQYYYDERVSQYLKKVENSLISYFLSNLKISPDGSSAFIVIDLLDNKKQYIGIFKKIGSKGQDSESILKQNVIFNIRPEASLQDKGYVYVVQRNEEGLFIQLIKIKFDNVSSLQKREDKSIVQDQKRISEKNVKINLLLKCKPHEEIKILQSGLSPTFTNQTPSTQNVVFELKQVGKKANQLYFIEHNTQNNQQNQVFAHKITINNSGLQLLFEKERVKDRFQHIEHWETNENNIYSECFEITDVGYAIIRYNIIPKQSSSYLKFGLHEQFSTYITLIPFEDYEENDQFFNSGLIDNKIEQPYLVEDKSKDSKLVQLDQDSFTPLQLNLENSKSKSIKDRVKGLKLDPTKEKIIFVSKDLHYFHNAEIKYSSNSNIYLLMNTSVFSVYNKNSLFVYPLRRGVQPYSFYLDGFPIQVIKNNIGSGEIGKVQLKLNAPLLSIPMSFTFWRKEIKQTLKNRIYSQTLTIKESEQGNIAIKILASSRYINKQIKEQYNNHPVILYLPSKNQKLDDILIQKMIEKGVTFIQIVQCRGIFGSNMVQFLRGSRSNYENYINDICQTLVFIKEHIANHIGIYAEGPSSSFATLYLNITENQDNQLFDCSVLHEGLYDLDQIEKRQQIFFGKDPKIFEKVNLFKTPVFTPTKSIQSQQMDKLIISKLTNIVFTSLSETERQQSRKFINKLRQQRSIVYDSVYLKQFDSIEQKDSFNLAYLFKTMNSLVMNQYKKEKKQKYDKLKYEEEGKARASRKSTSNNLQ